MALFHFSEEPNIRTFEPRRLPPVRGLTAGEPLVWAIDEWHSPMYFFPRECPRVLLWALRESDALEIERWIGDGDFRMAAYIEGGWLERVENCELFRYSFDAAPFVSLREAGMHVCRQVVEPLAVEPMGYLPGCLRAANVDLRPIDSLQPLADARLWESTLHFSGIRLRNARQWAVSP